MYLVISEHHLSLINDGLCNDEVSTDAELIENFIENGVNEEIAQAAICFRSQFFTDPFARLEMESGNLVFVESQFSKAESV